MYARPRQPPARWRSPQTALVTLLAAACPLVPGCSDGDRSGGGGLVADAAGDSTLGGLSDIFGGSDTAWQDASGSDGEAGGEDSAATGDAGTEDGAGSDDATAAVGDGDDGDDGDDGEGLDGDAAANPDSDEPVDTDTGPATLEVVSHTPTTGQAGTPHLVTFEITFNLPIKQASILAYTVKVLRDGVEELPGSFAVDGAKVTFTATDPVPPASRVEVQLTNLVQAQKGPSLLKGYTFYFYTAGYDGMAPYAQLAARYAPDIRQGIDPTKGKYDLLRAPDFDDDWDATNNATGFALTPAWAEVGWSVTETKSHYYIGYVYYWPQRTASAPWTEYDNDVSGAIVTVAKVPTERPVALTTWFSTPIGEEMWGWVTDDADLLPQGFTPEQAGMRGVLPAQSLFPDAAQGDTFGCEGVEGCTPRRFPAYLTAASHQSCMWLDGGDSTFDLCETGVTDKAQMKLIRYAPGAKADFAKADGKAPDEALSTYNYALRSVFDDWFPHRGEVGDGFPFVSPAGFVYSPPDGRPKGDGAPMGSLWRNTAAANEHGRPPWAWRWKPGTNATYYAMPRGTPWLDPAFALVGRLGGVEATTPWDPSAQKGISLDYCFAPFLFVDERGTEGCSPAP
jgi:hypothetical protein